MTKQAFPGITIHEGWSANSKVYYTGMTLRDYFAAKAMQATIENYQLEAFTYADRAKYAYKMADVMLEERGKKLKE